MATFDDWFYERENFSLRCERFYDDLMQYDMDMVDSGEIVKWLRAAYETGREHTLESLQDDGK